MEAKIVEEDVIAIAEGINKKLSQEEIEFVLDEYPSWQDNDPASMWNEVIENIIYFIENHR